MSLLDYASDGDSDVEVGEQSAVKPPGPGEGPTNRTAPVSAADGFHLPAPKSNRRRDPVKIRVDLPKPTDTDDGPPRGPQKKTETDNGPVPRTKGAGVSSLLSMLPAPKRAAATLPKPARVLGGRQGGVDLSGATTPEESNTWLPVEHPNAMTIEPAAIAPSGLFIPPFMTRSKVQPSQQNPFPKPVTTPPPKSEPSQSMNFFSLGTATTTSDASSSKPTAPGSLSVSGSIGVSSAPALNEYIPPEPTPTDPYPGYYQKPSGEWAAYDPEYYKTYWEQWQREAYGNNENAGGKGKRKDREWEGKEDQIVTADVSEEAKKGRIAEREAKKGLTGSAAALAVVHGDAKPRMNIQAKSHGRARQRGQLSSLLVEAYENRAVIEEKLAESRRNKKEAGNKYGF